jgi:hypothetical protein
VSGISSSVKYMKVCGQRPPLSCDTLPTPPSDERAGLQRVLAPTVRECDKNIATCAASQVNLTTHIDRLAHELEVLLNSMPEPAVELHAAKIKGIRWGQVQRSLRITSYL